MSRRVAITGGGGFVGQWLARALLANRDRVWLAGLGERPDRPRILTEDEWRNIHWMSCDVRRDEDANRLMVAAKPDLVIHLAGVSSLPDADLAPTDAYEINVLGAVRVTTAAARLATTTETSPLMLVVGSGTQYGKHSDEEMPLDESAEQRPTSAYGATKAAQEIAALQIGRAAGLRVICTRSFNHSGVGHGANFLLPSLAARARELLAAGGGDMPIGNDVIRDVLHIDDVVSAYLSLADRGVPGEVYNVCSGIGVSTRELAQEVIKQSGLKSRVIPDGRLVRTMDTPVLVGSPAKLRNATGWSPRKSHSDIISDLLAAT